MATVNFTSAKIFINGYALHASFNEIALSYNSETNDATTFGYTTRTNKGGLQTAEITGNGFLEFEAGAVEPVIFGLVGTDGVLITLFANGITEGTTTDKGFSMYGVIDEFNIGGAVGVIMPFTFKCATRGATP